MACLYPLLNLLHTNCTTEYNTIGRVTFIYFSFLFLLSLSLLTPILHTQYAYTDSKADSCHLHAVAPPPKLLLERLTHYYDLQHSALPRECQVTWNPFSKSSANLLCSSIISSGNTPQLLSSQKSAFISNWHSPMPGGRPCRAACTILWLLPRGFQCSCIRALCAWGRGGRGSYSYFCIPWLLDHCPRTLGRTELGGGVGGGRRGREGN